MSNIDAGYFNSQWLEGLGSASEKEKTAEATGAFIRDRLREAAFSRKIIPIRTITPDQCQVSTKHDQLIRIEEIEPNSTAMSISFRGKPDATLIRAPRFEIGFHTITSARFNKTEQELMAYRMPITKIIENNIIKDIQVIEDWEFINHVEAAIQANQQDYNEKNFTHGAFNRDEIAAGSREPYAITKGELAMVPGGSMSWYVQPLQRSDFISLKQLMINDELKGKTVLLHESDFQSISMWTLETTGNELQRELTVNGYKYNTISDLNVVRTIKKGVLRPGNVYLFTSPEFLGFFYELNPTKFWVDKEANIIKFQAWEDIGMGFGNIAAMRKLELYSNSVTPGYEDTGYAVAIPKPQEDLFEVKNKADDGLTFPEIHQY